MINATHLKFISVHEPKVHYIRVEYLGAVAACIVPNQGPGLQYPQYAVSLSNGDERAAMDYEEAKMIVVDYINETKEPNEWAGVRSDS